MARSYRVRSRVARLPILATSTSNGRPSCRKWSPNGSFPSPGILISVDPKIDYSKETPTLVEFRLEKTASGTLLLLTESGFDKIPSDRRLEAFRMNDGGWTEQMKNIESYVAQTS